MVHEQSKKKKPQPFKIAMNYFNMNNDFQIHMENINVVFK